MKGKQLKRSISSNFSLINNLESSIKSHLSQINTLYSEPLHEKIFESIGAKSSFSHMKKAIHQMNVNLITLDLIIQEARCTKNENAWISALKRKDSYINTIFNDIAPHKMLINYIDRAAYPSHIDKNQFKSIFNGVVEKAHELQMRFIQTESELQKRDLQNPHFMQLKSDFDEIHYNISQIAKLIITRLRGKYAIDPNQYAWVIIAQINLNHFEQELNTSHALIEE